MLDKKIQPDEKLAKIFELEMLSVNEIIRERMASENAPRIPEVTSHLIGAGGKRLRPMLTLAAARLFDYSGDKHLKLAATVEFIHTATLLHDDVVDESLKRRGRPTAKTYHCHHYHYYGHYYCDYCSSYYYCCYYHYDYYY